MPGHHLKIAFARRGYSPSGGAEAYLKRLGAGVVAAGHEAQLLTTTAWPADEWPFGAIVAIDGESPTHFADEIERIRSSLGADVLMSLERIWRCDLYRA